MIRPYLRDMINDHKTRRIWKVHSGNKVIDYKTQSERKFQLTIWINFMSSKDSDEIRTMRTKSYNVEIMMGSGSEIDDIIKELLIISSILNLVLNLFFKNIKKS